MIIIDLIISTVYYKYIIYLVIMEGEMFLTINPDTLNDEEIWTYRDLQLISTQLGLKANLKRSKLVANLTKWHRGRTEDDKNLVPDKQNEENLEMNVIGNNFALLAVNVNKKRKTRYSTSSRDSLLIVDYEGNYFIMIFIFKKFKKILFIYIIRRSI